MPRDEAAFERQLRRGHLLIPLPAGEPELYARREVLDGMAAHLAARHASEAEISLIRDLLDCQRQISPDDATTLMQQNAQLHHTIYEAARNRYLLSAFQALRDAVALLGPTASVVAGRPAIALAEHQRIVDAVERRDAEAADEAARDHIRTTVQIRLGLAIDSNGPCSDE